MDSKDTSVEKNGCIYLVTCLENGKTYIGQYAYENPTGRYTRHWAPNQKSPLVLLFKHPLELHQPCPGPNVDPFLLFELLLEQINARVRCHTSPIKFISFLVNLTN